MADIVSIASRRSWEDIATIDQRFVSHYWYRRACERLDRPIGYEELEAAAADPTPLRYRDKREIGFLAEAYGGCTAHRLIEDAIAWGRLLPREVQAKKSPWKQVSAAEEGELRAVLDFWCLSGGRVEPPAGRVARPPA